MESFVDDTSVSREMVLPRTNKSRTCFFYHRSRNYNVTIAYERVPGGIRYGASYCNPSDQFNKRRGRHIATQRMNMVVQPITVNETSARWEVHEAILNSMECGDYGAPENFKVCKRWRIEKAKRFEELKAKMESKSR